MCPRGSNHSLYTSVRRMNEHRKRFHADQGPVSSEEFISFESVQAVQTGIKNSYVEQRVKPLENDFRSESLFESWVGLLKTCIYHDEEENASIVDSALFVVPGPNVLWDGLFEGVVKLFARTNFLCRQPGSTMVRHQMMRDEQSKVSSKVFHPVTVTAAKRYAYHVENQIVRYVTLCDTLYQVTEFVYFCVQVGFQGAASKDILSILSGVLFEESVSIKQTFIAR